MSFKGFEGPAGTGKTHRLIDAALAHLGEHPLQPHQRVLALTFMHGSRRRLEERFSGYHQLRGRYVCMTIDSFAGGIARRWQTLRSHLGVDVGDFNTTCECCGRLLEDSYVARWVGATHPIVVVDEAQELSAPRLRIAKALSPHVALFVAGDEFQCLDESIDTAPFMDWFRTGDVTSLTHVHRTLQQGLLDAAAALRAGQVPPVNGRGFTIRYEFPNQARFAIGHALHNALRAGGDAAMIVAPAGPWPDDVIPRLVQGMQTRTQTVLPIRIGWEMRAADEVNRVMRLFEGLQDVPSTEIASRFALLDDPPLWLSAVSGAISHQVRVTAQSTWRVDALRTLIERKETLHRAYGYHHPTGIPVMTIHGAKNRQFKHVVVLWGYGVRGDPARQARLLYNAITRAERTCIVFVHGRDLLNAPPFA